MDYRRVRLTMTVLVGVAVVGLVATATYATLVAGPINDLPICQDAAPYDLNHDGLVNGPDFGLWVRTVHESGGECQLDGPAAGCPAWVDVNLDGVVSVADLTAVDRFMTQCGFNSLGDRP